MRRLASLSLMTVIIIISGCSPSGPEPDLSAILGDQTEAERADKPKQAEFDFGTVLARDQTLRHEFRIANRADRMIRIVGSRVKVPCCSGLGELPDSISPGGEATIPVFLKVGHVADRKRVSFEIETDPPALTRTLDVAARFVPEWEVEEARDDRGPLKIGQESKRKFRAIGRRKAGEGRRAPSEILASGDIEIESASSSTEVEGSDGVIESSRVLVVRLPGQAKSGDKSGSLTFRWPDGSSRTHEIRWSVKPSLEILPPTLILKPGATPIEVTVEVRSDDRPFRVVKVIGDLITKDVPPSDRAETMQILRITLDPGRVVPDDKPELEIRTDHPDQPTLTLRLVVLPPAKRGSE